MYLEDILEDIVSEKAPGPSPSFSVLDVLKSFELINDRGIGRNKLSMNLQLGNPIKLWRFILFKECPDPLVILFGGIDCIQNMFITIYKGFVAHFGNEVHRTICIITRENLQQAVFFLQTLVEPGTARSV